MSLPSSVKVGGARFAIREWSKDHADDVKLYGRIKYATRVIEIDEGATRSRAAETLLHEILHAIENGWLLTEDCKPERWVEVMACGLHAVIVDNPELFNWIVQQMKDDHTAGTDPAQEERQ